MNLVLLALVLCFVQVNSSDHLWSPIPENQDILSVNCESWTSKGYSTSSDETIVIPAGTCVTLGEFTSGETLVFEDGIDIQGRLLIPEGTKVIIRTKWVVVQGMLSMYSNKTVDGNVDVKFILFGMDELFFKGAHETNVNACNTTTGCEFGKKPFIVAGGVMDVKGLPDECPSWVQLLDHTFFDEIPNPGPFPIPKVFEVDNPCTRAYFENLEFASSEIHDIDNNCTIMDQAYYFSSKVKIYHGSKEGATPCKANGSDCISIVMEITRNWHKINSKQNRGRTFTNIIETLCTQDSGDYNEWFTCSSKDPIKFSESTLESNLRTLGFMETDSSKIHVSSNDPEAIVEVRDATLSLLPQDVFPDSVDPCKDLINNGDAHRSWTYPFYVDGDSDYLSIKEERVGGEKYFSHARRTKNDSIKYNIMPGCFANGLGTLYKFKCQIRMDTSTLIIPTVNIHSYKNGTSSGALTEYNTKIATCSSDEKDEDGWFSCEGSIELSERFSTSFKHTLYFDFGNETFDGDVDYKNLTFAFERGRVRGIVVDKSVKNCWGVGSEILLTSNSMDSEDQLVTEIKRIKDNGDSVTLFIPLKDYTLPRPSVADDPGRAVEVALLSRNIRLENEVDSDQLELQHGGHFMVFHTPNNVQTIQGIEILRFGQQGELGRYPMHFHLCDDVSGSVISKVLVRESFQRCFVVHNTDKLTLSENVAFNTFGHCFMIEDGSETENVYTRNLGAMTKDIPVHKKLPTETGETDDTAATFWISNPNNSYLGNVAAGATTAGFWFELRDSVRGPSAEFHPGVNPKTSELLLFKDNVAHSSKWGLLTFPNGYTPPNGGALVQNFHPYLNARSGVNLENSKNIDFVGGRYSDNWSGFEIIKSDAITVTGALIQGYSPIFMQNRNSQGLDAPCLEDGTLSGFRIPSQLSSSDWGVKIKDTHFQYLKEGLSCPKPIAFDFVQDEDVPSFPFNYMSAIHNATYDPGCAVVNFCGLNELDVKDAVLTDLDSTTSPVDGVIGTSALVTDDPLMKTFIDCVEMELSYCAVYCPGACIRRISFGVAPSWNGQVKITNGEKEVTLNAGVVGNGGIDQYPTQIFSLPLPDGSYNATFLDETGQISWPIFIEEVYGKEPECDGYLQKGAVSLNYAVNDVSQCQDFIKNGDMEMGSTMYWNFLSGADGADGIEVKEGGLASDFFIANTYHGISIGQYLDTQCISMMKGTNYQAEVFFKLMVDNMHPITCGANDSSECPKFFSLSRYYNDANMVEEKITDLGGTTSVPDADGWSKLSLDITLPLDWADYKSIFLYVKADSTSNLWLDNFSLKHEDYDMDASLAPTNKPSMHPPSTHEKFYSKQELKDAVNLLTDFIDSQNDENFEP